MGFEEDIEMTRKIGGDLERLLGKRKAREVFDRIREDVLTENKLDPKCYAMTFETGDKIRRMINLKAYEYIRRELGLYKDYFSEDLYKKLRNDCGKD